MVEGGIFTILDNCLQKISFFSEKEEIKVIALVNDKSKFNYPNIEYIEFPRSKKYWFLRLYYEYFYFKKFSKEIQPDIWFSLHDISPNVVAKKRFVYCHHPTVFYKSTLKDWRFDYKIGVFSILYKYLYQINIKKNEAVFVQQHWIKKEFEFLFNIRNVMVSKPEYVEKITTEKLALEEDKIHFLYPSFPRTFKNFEIIFNAIQLLEPDIKYNVKFHFTAIKDSPNKFAKHLFKKYNSLDEVVFWKKFDKTNRIELLKLYNSINCIVFPSKLETWGLPISEAKAFEKPMLLANLAYAKETIGDYDKVSFFDVDQAKELATLITKIVNKTIVYQGNKYAFNTESQFNDWNSIFEYILKD
jgi:glycosyltransferase involved in cell wall biosynthesis